MRLPLTARIITFYSFKGGVGRSMALLNCAYVLAGLGRRVLMIDMDLEAPGLSYLIEREESDRRKESGQEETEPVFRQGLVELIAAFAESPGDWPLARRADAQKIEDYISDLTVPEPPIRGNEPGRLSVLPAGRIDHEYEQRLSAIPWNEQPLRTSRDDFFRHLRRQILAAELFDFILVDARTGFSDEGYLATRTMADHLIVLSGMNQQNVLGTCQFLRQVQSWPQPESGPERKLVLVLSPVPEWEEEAKQRRRREMRKVFEEELGTDVDFSVELPYHPRVAMWEEAIVGKWPRSSLAQAYELLCQTVRGLAGDVPEHWVGWVEEAASFDATMSDAEIHQQADELSIRVAEAVVEVPRQAIALSQVLPRLLDNAQKVFDGQRFVAAGRLYGLYVEIADAVSSEFGLFNALIMHGRSCRALGRQVDAKESYERALRLSQRDEEKRDQSTALFYLAELDSVQGNYTESSNGYKESLAIDRKLGDHRGTSVSLHGLAKLDRLQGDYAGAQSKFDESLAIRHEIGDRRGIAQAIHGMAELDRVRGNYADARSKLDQSLSIFRELGNRLWIAGVKRSLAELDRLQGCYIEAQSKFDESLAVFHELGELRQTIITEFFQAACVVQLGGIDRIPRLRETILRSKEVGDPTFPLRGSLLLGESLIHLKRNADALPALDKAAAGFSKLGLRGFLADTEALQAIAHQELGHEDQAISAARSAVAFFDEQQVKSPYRDQLDQILASVTDTA